MRDATKRAKLPKVKARESRNPNGAGCDPELRYVVPIITNGNKTKTKTITVSRNSVANITEYPAIPSVNIRSNAPVIL